MTDVYDSGLKLENKAQVMRDLEEARGYISTALLALRQIRPPQPTSRLEALRNDYFRNVMRGLDAAVDNLALARGAVQDLFGDTK